MSTNFRRVRFAEAGEGCELVFRNSDLRRLFNELGPDYMQAVELGLNRYDADIIDKCLAAALKKNGEPSEVDIDALDHIPREKLVDKLLDAFTLSNSGRTYKEQVEWLIAESKRLEGQIPPLKSPVDSSAVSRETPSGQGSQPSPSGE